MLRQALFISIFKSQDKFNNLKSLQTNLSRLLKEYGYALNNDGKILDVLKKLEEENSALREKVRLFNQIVEKKQ